MPKKPDVLTIEDELASRAEKLKWDKEAIAAFPHLPPRDYQPTKAEKEREIDMPDADIVTVRNAFFRRVKVRKETPETD